MYSVEGAKYISYAAGDIDWTESLAQAHAARARGRTRGSGHGRGLPSLKVTIVPAKTNVAEYMQLAFDHQAQDLAIPFVTTLKDSGRIIRITRFFKIDRVNGTGEIGHTWISGFGSVAS